ncbi:hypothetical protein [Shewanella algae]|uniref:hypothetical protein n=1 Tax=Shewanella algae TaxID=38313 RepID=UPI001C59AB21|nr:hypothetical protein [Shewanella algae]
MLAPVTSFCILACPLLAAFILFFMALSPQQAMKHPSPEAQSMLFGYFELKAMSAVVPATKPPGEDGRWF